MGSQSSEVKRSFTRQPRLDGHWMQGLGGGIPGVFSYKLGWLTKTSGRKFLSEILDNLQKPQKMFTQWKNLKKKKTPKYHLLYMIDYAMIFRFGSLEASNDFSPLSSSNVVSHSARSFIWVAPRWVEDPSKTKIASPRSNKDFLKLSGWWLNHPVEKYAQVKNG